MFAILPEVPVGAVVERTRGIGADRLIDAVGAVARRPVRRPGA
ncbi:hypothetical protein [Streptomyces eurythermus]